MKWIIYIIMLLTLIIPVYGIVQTQEQVDAFDLDTFTWQTLVCECYPNPECQIHLINGLLHTGFTCYDIEPINGSTDYNFEPTIMFTTIPLEWGYECLEEHTESECTDMYWDRVVIQALNKVNIIIERIRSYQTNTVQDFTEWVRDIWE